MWTYISTEELYHHGVKGMKWGRRKAKSDYKSTSIKAAKARRLNNKVDEGFKKWKENTQKKETAIELGKKRNIAKLAYESDKTNKNLKSKYKATNKDYKRALKENTTYRKGDIRKEVGQDLSRKYLSDAKKVKKELDSDPSNKELRKNITI